MDSRVHALFLAFALALAIFPPSAPYASADVQGPDHTVAPLDAAATGTRLAQATAPAGTPPLKKFRVLLPFRIGITFFPISVANELGYLKDEGIDLDLQVANGS